IGDEPIDEKGPCARQKTFLSINTGRVCWHENERFHSRSGGIGSHGSARVSGRRTGNSTHTKFLRLGDGQRHSTCFKTAGWQAALVLDPEICQPEMNGQAARFQQWRHGFTERDWPRVAQREKFAVTPKGRGTILQSGAFKPVSKRG